MTSCAYAPTRTLRVGAATHVYEAIDTNGGQVVVKAARQDASQDTLGMSRFRREIALSNALRHPGLPEVIEHGDDWIAFEKLESSLSDDDARTAHSPLDVVLSLAETLAHLHARGVVHRDLKPAHVMFRGAVPVIIDLGVAGLVSNDPLEGVELAGSPAWMSPEQTIGAPPAFGQDIWSLSLIGMWLLTGVRPYSGRADEVLHARRAGLMPHLDLEKIRGTDQHLANLLQCGLEEAPRRPRAAQLVAELRRL